VAREGKAPSFMKSLNRAGAPWLALIAQALWTILLLLLPGSNFSTLLDYFGPASWMFYGLSASCVIRYECVFIYICMYICLHASLFACFLYVCMYVFMVVNMYVCIFLYVCLYCMYVCIFVSIFFMYVCIMYCGLLMCLTFSLYRLRIIEPDINRPFKIPFFPLPPLLVICIACFIIISSISSTPLYTILAFIFIFLSLPIHICIEYYNIYQLSNTRNNVHSILSTFDEDQTI